MRTSQLAAVAWAVATAVALPAYAEAPATPPGNSNAARSFEPGKVGPGSENNATVSPTSPSVPIDKQPPPEIPANANSGAGTGEQGSGPEGTAGPYNPAPPQR